MDHKALDDSTPFDHDGSAGARLYEQMCRISWLAYDAESAIADNGDPTGEWRAMQTKLRDIKENLEQVIRDLGVKIPDDERSGTAGDGLDDAHPF